MQRNSVTPSVGMLPSTSSTSNSSTFDPYNRHVSPPPPYSIENSLVNPLFNSRPSTLPFVAGNNNIRLEIQIYSNYLCACVLCLFCLLIFDLFSSEYTPLLEDFTDKFIESQLSISGPNQLVNLSQSKYVPEELLYICQQSLPVNPNRISSDATSLSSVSSLDDSYEFDQIDSPESSTYVYFLQLWQRFCYYCWCAKQLVLIISLMSFNFGLCFTPQIYINFFSMSHQKRTTLQNTPFWFDMICLALAQIVLSLLATICGLILLYSASNVINLLRRRIKFSIKYQLNTSPNLVSIYSWTILTIERIFAETFGTFCSKILALIMIIYLFAMTSIYLLILDDYVNMFFESLSHFEINNFFCKHQTFFNHQVLLPIGIALAILAIVGAKSNKLSKIRPKSISKLFLLSNLKNIASVVGLICLIYATFCVVYFHYQDFHSKSIDVDSSQISFIQKFLPKKTLLNISFDWNDLSNKNWLLLLASVPLLIMPFHINDILVMLLYSSYSRQYYNQLFESGLTRETLLKSLSTLNGKRPITPNENRLLSELSSRQYPSSDTFPQSHLYRDFLTEDQSAPSATVSQMDVAPSVPPVQLSISPPILYLTSLNAFKHFPFFSTYQSVRDLYILASVISCLLSIVINAYVYMSTFDSDNTVSAKVYFLKLNFLRQYLKDAMTNDTMRYLTIIAVALLSLKTIITYILLVFRGILSLNCFFEISPSRPKQITDSEQGSSFQFVTPFVVWSCLSLLFALFMEYNYNLLQITIWTATLLGLIILMLIPSILLLYFAKRSLCKQNIGSNMVPNTCSILFKPMRCAKFFFTTGLLLLVLSIFFISFWIYTYFYTNAVQHQSLLSMIHLIEPVQNTTLSC